MTDYARKSPRTLGQGNEKNSNQGALSTYMCLEWWIFVLRPWLISYYFQISHAIQLEFKSQPLASLAHDLLPILSS